MKSTQEVCKIVGVTRKTLRFYDEIGLLHPTSKTEQGYWQYDDNAIKVLILIQIFVEAGYQRKEIKNMIYSPDVDMVALCDQVIDTLREKRKRIDGMINTIKILQIIAVLPEKVLKAMSYADVSRIYKNKSSADYLDETIINISSETEGDMKKAELSLPFFYHLIAIGCLMKHPPGSERVQECVVEFYNYWVQLISNELDEDKKIVFAEYTEAEIISIMVCHVKECLSNPDFVDLLVQHSSEAAPDFIVDALTMFGKTRCNEEEDFEDLLTEVEEVFA